ncbi:MAG: adenylosuccinate lyase [Proteobacteria bacterium]|nr:adenylosuccinate lyase [Pseudomonadota bacterium]MBU1714049.1 adenylosuccinate lyase [Pseudomonadota bacterium]
MTQCQSLHSHIVDSPFYGQGYSTREARQVFCAFRRLQRWLEVETALAASQAELGIIPAHIHVQLKKTADLGLMDLEAIKADIANTGHSLIPLLNAWQGVSDQEAAKYIHFGATTQDIQDTAQSLELREIISILERDLRIVIQELSRLSQEHSELVIIGRTHGQHALPTTLGLKFAIWLDEMLRNAQRLAECKKRLLVSQLFGGVGTMDAFGEKGPQLLDLFSAQLGLAPAATAWHTSRDRLAEFLSTLAIITGTLAKIANEICQLARDEIGELEEPFHMGKIGSTTMPHKRNPELCEQVVVLAKLVKSSASLGFDGLINEHERDYRAVRLEWVTLADASLYTCGAFELMKNILQKLVVRHDNVGRNLEKSACLISTEVLMFMLGEKIGKQKAHQLLYELSMNSRNNGQALIDLLLDNQIIKENFDSAAIKEAVNPAHHTGSASLLTKRVIDRAEQWLSENEVKNDKLRCPLNDNLCGCRG